MLRPRWKKVRGDLTGNKTRSLLAAAAIAFGIFGTGTVWTAKSVLTREIEANFMGTNPASAILEIDNAGRRLARTVAELEQIDSAEVRGFIEARVETGPDIWRRIQLFVIDDFDSVMVSKFVQEYGDWPPAENEILIERSAMPFVQRSLGDSLHIETPNGQKRFLRIGGVVHDAGQSPGWIDGLAYGYVNRETVKWLGESGKLNELRIVVNQDRMNEAHVSIVAYEVRTLVQSLGYTVGQVRVPKPGAHPHADQMLSLLFLLQSFGLLSLILGAVLVADIVSALMAQQIQHIGIMKAIGTSAKQISAMYIVGVIAIALTALIPAMLVGQAAGLAYADFVSGILNFELTSTAIPIWVPIMQVAVAVGVPLATAAVPIYRGTRVSVRRAIGESVSADEVHSKANGGRTLPLVEWLGRPALLSIRNTFRQRGRLVLTVAILAVGGATFMSAINVSVSWTQTIDKVFEGRRYDLKILFAHFYPASKIRPILKSIEGVRDVETWQTIWAQKKRDDGAIGDFRFIITGVTPSSEMLRLPLIEGRWLEPGDTRAMVVNHELVRSTKVNLHVGDEIVLEINGEPTTWNIVGAVREIGVRRRGQSIPGSAYVNVAYLGELNGTPGLANNIVLSADNTSNVDLEAMAVQIEQAFDEAEFRRTVVKPTPYRRKELVDHLLVIQMFLLTMGALVAVVGGFALGSTMSLNVMQRTREIGVMRAIGGSTAAIIRIIVLEGVAIGVLSWFVAVLISIPLSILIGDFAGEVFVHAPLDNTVSLWALFGWLGIVIAVGIGVSTIPAYRATRVSVQKALNYR